MFTNEMIFTPFICLDFHRYRLYQHLYLKIRKSHPSTCCNKIPNTRKNRNSVLQVQTSGRSDIYKLGDPIHLIYNVGFLRPDPQTYSGPLFS